MRVSRVKETHNLKRIQAPLGTYKMFPIPRCSNRSRAPDSCAIFIASVDTSASSNQSPVFLTEDTTMKPKPRHLSIAALFTLWALCLLLSIHALAQGTQAEYDRAVGLREAYVGVGANLAERANWIGKTPRFWYRKAVKGGNEFVVFDAETLAKKPAFDHARLATALNAATGEKYTALKLPFTTFNFVDNEKAIEFNITDTRWHSDLNDYSVKKLPPGGPGAFGQRRGGIPLANGIPGPRYNFPQGETKTSPDGKWDAQIRNFNVWVRAKGAKDSTCN